MARSASIQQQPCAAHRRRAAKLCFVDGANLRQGFPGLAEWLIRTAAFVLPIGALSCQDHDCGGCTQTNMINSCGATTLWAREFWSEIVNRRSILSRHGDEVDLLGWKVRLAWDEDADHGTLYVRPRNVARKELDRRIFISTELNPREQARLLLTQLAVIDASRRIRQ